MNLRTLVIGLDGATWNYLKPKLDILPNLEKIITQGVSGKLKSCIPPWSFPAWKCYSTGKRPGKLGIYYFVGIDFDKKSITLVDSTTHRGEELWDYLSRAHTRVGVINMPGTYPVKEVNGVMVGGPFSTETGYTYPNKLQKELKKFHYRVCAEEFIMQPDIKENINSAKDVIKNRFAAAKYIIDEYNLDFLHLTIFHIDTFQHFMWGTNELDEVWRLIDEEIGKIVEYVGEECRIILMSDHGFQETKERVYLNSWLLKYGYLALNKRTRLLNLLRKINISQEKIYVTLKCLGLISLFKKIIPKPFLRRIGRNLPTHDGLIGVENLGNIVDWRRTKAIALAESIYINARGEERQRIKAEIKSKLMDLKHQGKSIVKNIFDKEELYSVIEGRAPDFIIQLEEGFLASRELKISVDLLKPKSNWKAHHDTEGILIVKGPEVRRFTNIEGAEIIDLCPTILHWLNIPIPLAVDGKVLKDIFAPDSSAYQREVTYYESKEKQDDKELSCVERDEVAVYNHLQGLGYL